MSILDDHSDAEILSAASAIMRARRDPEKLRTNAIRASASRIKPATCPRCGTWHPTTNQRRHCPCPKANGRRKGAGRPKLPRCPCGKLTERRAAVLGHQCRHEDATCDPG